MLHATYPQHEPSAILARASTPPSIVDALLADQPLSVAHVERAICMARQETAESAVPT